MPTELIKRLQAESGSRRREVDALLRQYWNHPTYEAYRVRVPDRRPWIRRTKIGLYCTCLVGVGSVLGFAVIGELSILGTLCLLGLLTGAQRLIRRWVGPFVYYVTSDGENETDFITRRCALTNAPERIVDDGAHTIDDLRAALEALDRKVERDLLAVEPRAIEILLEDGRDQ